MKIPLPATTQIKRISQTVATSIDEFESLLKNVTVEMVGDAPRCSRRRGALVSYDASTIPISPTFGRGIFAPAFAGSNLFYLANYNTIYRNTYGTVLGTLGNGLGLLKNTKVFFTSVEDGSYDTVVVDVVNDSSVGTLHALNITTSTMTKVVAIPGVSGAGVWMSGWFFLPDGTRIYNSTLNDVTAGYVDFISSEVSPDPIQSLALHHDHVVALGVNSIEFFYLDSNPGATGSPLRPRRDVYYTMGLVDLNAWDANGDIIYFVAQGDKGDIALKAIDNFQIRTISDARFNRWLTVQWTTGPHSIVVATFSYEGRTLIAVTLNAKDAGFAELDEPVRTFIFEEDGRVYEWDVDGAGTTELSNFPLTGFSHLDTRTSTSGKDIVDFGMMGNGDVFAFRKRNSAPDTFKDDFGTKAEFTSEIQFNDFDGDLTGWKFCSAVEPYGDFETGCTFNLSWSDEGGAYNTPRVLTKANRQRAVSCGRFSRRKFRLTSTDDSDTIDEHMELEGLDADIELGSY